MDIQTNNYVRPEIVIISAEVMSPLASSPLEDPQIGKEYEW